MNGDPPHPFTFSRPFFQSPENDAPRRLALALCTAALDRTDTAPFHDLVHEALLEGAQAGPEFQMALVANLAWVARSAVSAAVRLAEPERDLGVDIDLRQLNIVMAEVAAFLAAEAEGMVPPS